MKKVSKLTEKNAGLDTKEIVIVEKNQVEFRNTPAAMCTPEGRVHCVRFYRCMPEHWTLQIRGRKGNSRQVRYTQVRMNYDQLKDLQMRIGASLEKYEKKQRGK